MVKKLFKHEILFYLRVLVPVECAVLALAVLTRVLMMFENGSDAYATVFGLTVSIFVMAMIAGVVSCFVMSVNRFQKNLFSCEGYLTFTLPFTPAQHVFVKLGTAVLMEIAVLLLTLAIGAVACSGDLLTEILKAAKYLLGQLLSTVPQMHLALYIVEILLLFAVYCAYQYLLIYACICIGQTARKNRTGAAFGVYFLYLIIQQILGTVAVAAEENLYTEEMVEFMEKHYLAIAHVSFCGSIMFYLILSTVAFFICNYVLNKKLNLE